MSASLVDEAATWLAAEHELLDRIADAMHARFGIDRADALAAIVDAIERLRRGLV